MHTRQRFCILLFAFVSLLLLGGLAGCRRPNARIVADQGSASMSGPNDLLTALSLTNEGHETADDVAVDSIKLEGATLTLPVSLPVSLGKLRPDDISVLDANFSGITVAADSDYKLTVHGTFREHGHRFTFRVEQTVHTDPASPGSRVAQTGTATTLHVSGAPYPAQKPNFGTEINDDGHGPPIPTGPVRPNPPSKASAVQAAPAGPGGGGGGGVGSIHFPTNSSLGFASSVTAEPSGASGGGVVFETANWWAGFSINGGAFTQLNPTKVFPNSTDSGFCCDQVVQYVPSIDRFVWLLQYGPTTPAPNPNPKNLASLGPGLYRIAWASPAEVKSSNGTSWTYFDVTSQVVLGTAAPSPWFDYPDASYGNTYYYLSGDNVNGGGHAIIRITLADMTTPPGGTVHYAWTKPSDSNVAWGGHLSQNTTDQVFWAGHESNSQIRVFNWPESSGSYSWRDINIGSWPKTSCNNGTCTNPLTSLTPDNQNWFQWGFPGNSVLGLARSYTASVRGENKQNLLYLAWTGGIGNGFPQPQVQWIALDIDNNFALVSQQQVWNPNYAYGYPAFGVNTNNELGMSLEWGGGGNYENHVAGFWGDYVVYSTTNSNVGSIRFGDYVTIRRNTADPTKFDAFGYGMLQSSPPGNPTADVRYIVFSR